MTKKTGQRELKARQLARGAKLMKYKQMLTESGESLELPRPSLEEERKKEEELKNIYLEILAKSQRNKRVS